MLTHEVYSGPHDEAYLFVYDGEECIYCSPMDGFDMAETIEGLQRGEDPRRDDWISAPFSPAVLGELVREVCKQQNEVMRPVPDLAAGSLTTAFAAACLRSRQEATP